MTQNKLIFNIDLLIRNKKKQFLVFFFCYDNLLCSSAIDLDSKSWSLGQYYVNYNTLIAAKN